MMNNVERVRHKVKVKLNELQRNIPGRKNEYLKTKESLLRLGVTPETTYLFIQGHHLFDNIVAPTMQAVCDELRKECERDIRNKAQHILQLQNELAAYNKSQSDIPSMLKKNLGYTDSPQYRMILKDVERILNDNQQ